MVGHPQAARGAPQATSMGQSWRIEDALELYNVPAWGSGLLLDQCRRPRGGTSRYHGGA